MDAILVTRENISDITANLIDMPAQRLLDRCDYMLNASIDVVLVREDVAEYFIESGILSGSMFYGTYETASPLNDKNFVPVTKL